MHLKTKIAFGFMALVGGFSVLCAQTVALPYQVVINPIFIQNGAGGGVAVQTNYASSLTLFQDATQRLFAQAGIRLVWQAPSTYVSSAFYTIGAGAQGSIDIINLAAAPGNGAAPTNANIVNLWFTGPTSTGTLGVSGQSTNLVTGIFSTQVIYKYATVSETVFNSASYYSLSTIAHEIGHVLGLKHESVIPDTNYAGVNFSGVSVPANNLMKGETVGATSYDQIFSPTNTGGFGVLTAEQITMLRLSPLVTANPVAGDSYNYSAVPEPATEALLAGVFAGLSVMGYRRWVRSCVA